MKVYVRISLKLFRGGKYNSIIRFNYTGNVCIQQHICLTDCAWLNKFCPALYDKSSLSTAGKMPDVIALYKIAYLYTRIVLPLCTWSLSTKSNLFLFLVMWYVNEPFKITCVVLIRKIKASPSFVECLQRWGKQ